MDDFLEKMNDISEAIFTPKGIAILIGIMVVISILAYLFNAPVS